MRAIRNTFPLALMLSCSAWGQYQRFLPVLGFEENSGQYSADVRFIRRTQDRYSYLTRDSFVLQNQVRIQLVGIRPEANPTGDVRSEVLFHSYQGRDPKLWRPNSTIFETVREDVVYPGIDAVFGMGRDDDSVATGNDRGKITLVAAPGADFARIRVRVADIGITPTVGPGGIWYYHGSIPGVFILRVRTTQPKAGTEVLVESNLKIEANGVLSYEAPGLDPTLPATIELAFPNYEGPEWSIENTQSIRSGTQPQLYFASATNLCVRDCTDAIVYRVDPQGKTVWATVLGGGDTDRVQSVIETADRVVIAGVTQSKDFPSTSNAPYPDLRSIDSPFLAVLDSATGRLRDSTPIAVPGAVPADQVWINHSSVGSNGDVVVVGGRSKEINGQNSRGYFVRWNAAQDRVAFALDLATNIVATAFDSRSNVWFASVSPAISTRIVQVGFLDLNGVQTTPTTPLRSIVPGPTSPVNVQLVPASAGEVWAIYEVDGGDVRYTRRAIAVAKLSPARGTLVNRILASTGKIANIGFTPSGLLKVLVEEPGAEFTTPDAPLVAPCFGAYFVALLPAGETHFATFLASRGGSEFASWNEAPPPPSARLGCASGAVPGQIMTIAGGGFGPTKAVSVAPDPASGKYPLEAGGLRVRIAGLDAPIIGIGRGLIDVQVPFELNAPTRFENDIEVSLDGQMLNPLSLSIVSNHFSLFYTGERESSTNLPVIVAVNQDGSVNSRTRPARAGSIVTMYGTGLGALTPPLVTGEISPLSPLSVSRLLGGCNYCQILYLGSAPGLSTGIVQINARVGSIASAQPGPLPLSIGVTSNPRDLGLLTIHPTGVIFVE